MIMCSSEPKKTSDGRLSPIAKNQPNLNAFPVMSSPPKDCGSKRPLVDSEPPINAWKKSCMTLPTKVTDDPFIDDKKLSSKLVPIGHKKKSKMPTISLTQFKSLHSERQHYCSPNTLSISLTRFESSHSERRYYCSPKTPTISLTRFESLHSERQYYCSPKMPTISFTRFESSYSEEQYCRSTKTPTISLTGFESLHSGN